MYNHKDSTLLTAGELQNKQLVQSFFSAISFLCLPPLVILIILSLIFLEGRWHEYSYVITEKLFIHNGVLSHFVLLNAVD